MTDGEYSWLSDLAYYVEKYNLRLPEEFEGKVLKKLLLTRKNNTSCNWNPGRGEAYHELENRCIESEETGFSNIEG